MAFGAARPEVDASHLESLVGYCARRASDGFARAYHERMTEFGLTPLYFAVLNLIVHNPGITAAQLCDTLNLRSPNLVLVLHALESRQLMERRRHARDARAKGLHPSASAIRLMRQAEQIARLSEAELMVPLTDADRRTLLGLLHRIFKFGHFV